MINHFFKIIFVCLFCLSMTSCVPVVAGAAVGVAGTVAVYNNQTIKETLDDNDISNRILRKLRNDRELVKRCHIGVTTYHRTVLLVGQVPEPALKERAERFARSVYGIKRFYNEITIQGPTSMLVRANDSLITTKVKSLLLATKGLRSGQIKVLTEDGTVFLIGVVSRSQGSIAADVAKQVGGISKVVKVFQYVPEKKI